MPRIAGVDIPENKQLRYSLRYIHGIGPHIADQMLEKAQIDGTIKASKLTEDELARAMKFHQEALDDKGDNDNALAHLCHALFASAEFRYLD